MAKRKPKPLNPAVQGVAGGLGVLAGLGAPRGIGAANRAIRGARRGGVAVSRLNAGAARAGGALGGTIGAATHPHNLLLASAGGTGAALGAKSHNKKHFGKADTVSAFGVDHGYEARR